MPNHHRVQSTLVYQGLLSNPRNILRQMAFSVNALPGGADGAASNLFFAVGANGMVVDQVAATAAALANVHVDGAIQKTMLVSNMRGYNLAVGIGGRHQPTNAVAAGADLWVTEMQTGCTVLIIDWGGNQYSLMHLQPSDDAQFNRLGRGIINLSNFTRSSYKNAWLKSESTTIVGNTGGAPQYYIMIQSMFDASSGRAVQVVGVRRHGKFEFYRQKQYGNNLTLDHLAWCGWYSYLPYRSY